MALVSVIVPIYNVEEYLHQCIDSIIQQTYYNLEILLVDDGSSDNSGVIAEDYANSDNRIKVYHKKNGGLSDARNYGIDHANGDYFTFVDSDDFIVPKMIENMVIIAEKELADIVECRNCRCSSEDTIFSVSIPDGKINTRILSGNDRMRLFLSPTGIKTTAWAKLYKRELFNNVRFPVGKYHEDVFTTYKLIDLASRVALTDFVGYVYRNNKNSITKSTFNIKRLDAIDGKLEQATFIKAHYPDYAPMAYVHIVYSCNSILRAMADSKYVNKDVFNKLSILYKQYGIYYLKANVSKKGKLITSLAMVNINLAYITLRYFA